MQGFTRFNRPVVKAKLSKDMRKKDPRRIFVRGMLTKDEDGGYIITPDNNQSSGSFGVIQRSSCLAVMPEGLESKAAGDLLDCIMLDISEEVVL